MRIRSPFALELEYTRQMMAWLLFLDPPQAGGEQAIGTLGLGAGSLTRFCLKHTDSPVHAVEWNPSVTGPRRPRLFPPARRQRALHGDP